MENRSSAKGAAPGRSSGQRKAKATPQLSCELCRDRKVKCDKLEPCSNCVAFGVECVPIYRLRLPRGRHVHRSRPASASSSASALHMVNETLTKRIHRLEALVNGLGPRAAEDASSAKPRDEQATTASASLAASSSLLPRSTRRQPVLQRPEAFWADLVEEIHGLRDAIESAPNEPSEDSAQTDAADDDGSRVLGLAKTVNYIAAGLAAPTCLDPAVTSHLCHVYLRQVDPIIKILHRPSLTRWMLQGERYLSYPERHASVDALRSAVCYAAVNSMTEDQCWATFHAAKSGVLADHQRDCEASMERSGLLTTGDVTVLQAFLLYLFARRSQDRSRAVWTLIAVAVRVAKGLGLYLDPDEASGQCETFYEQQTRRRLWLTVCLMDLQASFRQATEPLVSFDEAASSLTLPRHINDSDFDRTTTRPVPDREGLTDTTFALVTYHAQLGGRLMNFGAAGSGRRGASPPPSNGDTERQERQLSARRFEQEALRLLHFCDPESSPYAWFTWHGTQSLVASARLSVLRPLHRARSGRRAPPPTPRAESDTELLQLTLSVLEKTRLMHTDPRGEAFRWFVTVPWHALAIAAAECYVCTDAVLVRHAWPIVEESYQHLGDAVAPGPNGQKPHGPLATLMRRTRDKLASMLPRSAGAHHHGAVSGSRHLLPRTGFSLAAGNSAPNLLRTCATCPPTPANSAVTAADSPWPVTMQNNISSMLPATPSAPLTTPQKHAWSPASVSLSPQSQQPGLAAATGGPAGGLTPLQDQASDQSWQVWEDFLSGFSSSDLADPGLFYPDNNLGAY